MRLSLTCTYQRQRSCMPIACRVPQRAKTVMCLTLHADPTIQYNYHTSPYLCHIFVLLCSAMSVTSTGFSPPSMRKLPYDTTWWEIHYSLHTPYWKSWWKKIKNRPVAFEALFISLSLLMPFPSTFLPPLPSVPLWNVSPTLWWCMDATMARNSWLSGSWNTRLRLSTSSLMRYKHVHWGC